MAPRRIVAVTFPGVQVLDVTGPLEVFSMADRLAAKPGSSYRNEVVSPAGGLVRSSSAIGLDTIRLGDCRGTIDTLVVAGGIGTTEAVADRALIDWIAAACRRTRRITSVCSGAFLLAEAGILDGLQATTHWSACELLAQRHPGIAVDADPIFVRDGRVWTSAGVTTGMDLALALVEEDHGPALALEVARHLVMFLKRPGSQSQFSGHLSAQLASREPLRDLQGWLADHLDENLSVPVLAARVSMSTRSFARAFRAEVGTTPGEYVERLRVDAARGWLAMSDRSIPDIATSCGFGTVETMYRAFQRNVRVSPAAYRRRFRPHAATATA